MLPIASPNLIRLPVLLLLPLQAFASAIPTPHSTGTAVVSGTRIVGGKSSCGNVLRSQTTIPLVVTGRSDDPITSPLPQSTQPTQPLTRRALSGEESLLIHARQQLRNKGTPPGVEVAEFRRGVGVQLLRGGLSREVIIEKFPELEPLI